MSRTPGTWLALGACLLVQARPLPAAKYVLGPPPEWTHYKATAEPAVRARLPHARDDLVIGWPNGYFSAPKGYLSCGTLRSPDAGDGQSLSLDFLVVIDKDQVTRLDIATLKRRDLTTAICREVVRRGMLPLTCSPFSGR